MKANEYDKRLGLILRLRRLELFDKGDPLVYSLDNLSSTVGWTPVRLMTIERGDRPITGHEMVLLCRLYGLDIQKTIEEVWGKA